MNTELLNDVPLYGGSTTLGGNGQDIRTRAAGLIPYFMEETLQKCPMSRPAPWNVKPIPLGADAFPKALFIKALLIRLIPAPRS